eukprot:TRINITY_DN11831_c0_g2_i1.p1 TRINITY_DN11831_c0_g2~~TRINITY_DN11831_c0_g2_i1.p1  ORF type:complete len:570 (-),score=139.92 TRINITY_DN11831_c0_g2_i1:8-1717(-)
MNNKQPPAKKLPKKKTASPGGAARRASNGDRTVRRLRLSKALTLPDTTLVSEACRRMAARRTDAVLLTDSSGLLCGILTDRDLSMKVIGDGLQPDQTMVQQVMTRNPVFVTIESSAVDALQKMVQGKFRHLPVVENQEVVALLDITKCLYDAITRMERAAEKGNAMAVALEGVERQFGNTAGGQQSFIETFRDKVFRPTLGSLVGDQTKVPLVQGTDAVYVAAKCMREQRCSCVVVVAGDGSNKPKGILTSKDILMRVMAMGMSAAETAVEKVMTPNPECASLDTPIVDALHVMHDGKFLHLPIIDRDGNAVACVDVIHLTNGAVQTAMGGSVGPAAAAKEQTEEMMQRFLDSALALEGAEVEEDATSVRSSDYADTLPGGGGVMMATAARSSGGAPVGSFAFKMEDRKGRVHRFTCGMESLTELTASVAARCGKEYDPNDPPAITYVDEDGDKVLLSSDADLAAAVHFARTSQAKNLRLHLDYDHTLAAANPYSAAGSFQSSPRSQGPPPSSLQMSSSPLSKVSELEERTQTSSSFSPAFSAALSTTAVLVVAAGITAALFYARRKDF